MADTFLCSICGTLNPWPATGWHRELVPCSACDANARFRAIGVCLSWGLVGRARPLALLHPEREITGLGVSDADLYATWLERKFSYTNTFLHRQPRLDIEDAASVAAYPPVDFLVCSDVIEHTLRPVRKVLRNLSAALKPGGLLVISAPTYEMDDTVERYPSLAGYRTDERPGSVAVIYQTRFGSEGCDPQPRFHGGPGQVLELRAISHPELLEDLAQAGFEVLPVPDEALRAHGAVWPRMIERRDIPHPLNGSVLAARRR
jgi:SAM-dependent methyltransferase